MRRSSHRESGSGHRGPTPSLLKSSLAAALAGALTVGTFLGFVTAGASGATLPACTASSTTTCAVELTMTSGSFGVHGNTPADIPGPAAITGTLDPTTGRITGATLGRLSYHISPSVINTNSTETVIITQITPGTGTGLINYLGNVTYTDSLDIVITVHSPATQTCLMSPVEVNLASTTPYSSGAVTLSQKNLPSQP